MYYSFRLYVIVLEVRHYGCHQKIFLKKKIYRAARVVVGENLNFR